MLARGEVEFSSTGLHVVSKGQYSHAGTTLNEEITFPDFGVHMALSISAIMLQFISMRRALNLKKPSNPSTQSSC